MTCLKCKVQFIGQSTKSMVARHSDQLNEVKTGANASGQHFLEKHGGGLDLNKEENLAICLQKFSLQVIASVKPPETPEEEPDLTQRLDRLEAKLQQLLHCIKE